MFQISGFKYTNVAKYGCLSFFRTIDDMDSDELKKLTEEHDRINIQYPGVYNPIRMGPRFIGIQLVNGTNLKCENGNLYDVTVKIQKYTYNTKQKLRAIIVNMSLSSKSIIYEDA